jgi:hypothetical protein
VWCKDNNPSLNVIKTKEMIVDYRKWRTEHAPILLDGAVVEQVESFKFLGVHITNKKTLSKHTKTVVNRARHKFIPSCTIKSILTGCITAWYGNCSASDHKALQCGAYGPVHPAIQDLYTRRCQRNALKSVKDSSHPCHRLFSLLPHNKRYRSGKSRTKMLLNSFYPQAIRPQAITSNHFS